MLPIGGVKEKVLAAFRFGIKTVILPKENEKDLAEIPDDIRDQMEFHLVEDLDEVLSIALEEPVAAMRIGDSDSGSGIEPSGDESVTH